MREVPVSRMAPVASTLIAERYCIQFNPPVSFAAKRDIRDYP